MITMRRITLLVLLLLLAAVAIPAGPGLARTSQSAGTQPNVGTQADFNQDGFADLAIGAPGEDVGTVELAGVVNVIYGAASGLNGTGSQLFTQIGSAPEEGDRFGGALATGDFNQDGFADLAIGAPDEDVGSIQGAGAVSILYGATGGLTTAGGRLFTQVGGAVETGDGFGRRLTAGDFNHDGFADLTVGASGEDVGSASDAGAVSVLYGAAGGLTTAGGRLFTQLGGAVEARDGFGFAVAAGDFNHDNFADLAASAPFETVGSLEGAGVVSILYGAAGGLTTTGGWLFTQVGGAVEEGDLFGGALAAGDFNHDNFADLAAGAEFEDVGSRGAAGAVSVLYGAAGGLTASGGQLFTQVGGTVEAFDFFGGALAAGDFNHDSFTDLAASAVGEDVGTLQAAGTVSILYGSAGGLTAGGGQLFTQVGGAVEAFDFFGWAVAAGDFNHDSFADLAAGAPEENFGGLLGPGAVSILYGTAGGVTTAGGQLFTQDSPGIPGIGESLDGFGSALTSGGLGAVPAGAASSGSNPTTRLPTTSR
jgi:hypothetical protein